MSFILDDACNLRDDPPRFLNIFTIIQVLFGGGLFQSGALLFWVGMTFTIPLVENSEVYYFFTIDGAWIETTAVVEYIEKANFDINGEDYYRFNFQFTADGQELKGGSLAPRGKIMEGQSVPVEYCFLNTDRARIVGMRNKELPVWVAFVLILPLAGLISMIIGLIANKKLLKLLKIGHFTRGKKQTVTLVGTKKKKYPVYVFKFTFEVADKSYIATCKTDLKKRVEDEKLEKILYDPRNPNYNLVYDGMDNVPAIDELGKLVQAGPAALGLFTTTVLGFILDLTMYLSVTW